MPNRIVRAVVIVISLGATSCAGRQNAVSRSAQPRPSIVANDSAAYVDRYLTAAAAFGFSGSVLIGNPRGVALSKGYGLADEVRPVTADMLFDMGSIVKQFTAAGILLLESEGKLSTADRLARFFPTAPADKASITLHQVLTHTSGLTDNPYGDYDAISRDSMLSVVFKTPLVSPPGREFNYSNAGFSLLAAIIEQVSGQTYDGFMYDRVFHPSGMEETGYHVHSNDSTRVAHTFTPPVDHGSPTQRLARASGPSWALIGNGGMLTTVGDLFRYELALQRGFPITPVIQAKQFTEQFRPSAAGGEGYDWAILPAEDGGLQFTRAGDAPAFGLNAEYRRYPKDGSAFILLANNRHHGGSTRRFIMPNLRQLYVGAAKIDVPSARLGTSKQLASLLGWYRVDSASFIRIDSARGRLVLTTFGQGASNLLIFNRDTTSIKNRERINYRVLDVAKALATADTATQFLGSPARRARVMHQWSMAEQQFGGFRCVQVLGTDRLDRGVFLTTARLQFANATRIVRFTWSGVVPIVNSDDQDLPRTFGFAADSPVEGAVWSPYWYAAGADSIMTFDLASNQTLTATVVRGNGDNVQRVSFHLPERVVQLDRIQTPSIDSLQVPTWCR